MQRLFVLALAAIPIVLGSLRPANPAFQWWTVDGLQKVRPYDPVPAKPQSSVQLYAAVNEFEPFQIVFHAEAQDLRDVDIDVTDLKGPDGAIIAKQNITLYFEAFIRLDTPSSGEGRAGEWPDALIPRVDRYYGEKRNAFPFKLAAGRNQ